MIRDTVDDEDQVDVVVPFNMLVTGWTLVADQSGSIELDLWSDSYANYPPTDTDSIVGANPPELSSQSKNQATGLSWALTKGHILRAIVVEGTVVDVTRVTLALTGVRTL